MIVHWQRVGFVHGVMNTDNIYFRTYYYYGPYGWLEDYNPIGPQIQQIGKIVGTALATKPK
jgi:uncharacterized protein YdiU (UPF0061 family)